MSLTLDELAAGGTHTADFKRDRWGRPNIMQPDGKRKPYTRCSSAAKTVEDTYNLEKWARRNIAYGMAYDASLVARVIALGGEPSTWGKTEKDAVNEILEAADAVAKAHKRADMGTAVHHMTHRVDRGETFIGGPYQADIDAYVAAMKAAHLNVYPQYTECRMVNDDLEMAGTADRIVLYDSIDMYRIADIKTGATIDFGGLGWSAQLAAYAGGLLYDVTTEQRIETPPIDRKVGLIIHLPAGEGRCDIYEVDIAQGLTAARLANDIRSVRKAAKKWITPITKNSGESQPAVEADSPEKVASSVTDEATTSSVAGTTGRTQSSPQSTPPSVDAAVTEPNWRFEAKRRYGLLNDEQRAEYTARKASIDTSNQAQVFALLDEVEPFNRSSNTVPCRSCGARMIWAVTRAGKRMPINAEPSASGNLLLSSEGIVDVHEPGDGTDFDQQYYISHFATCPNASSHRKRTEVRPFAPDEGDTVDPSTIAARRSAFEALSDAAQLWISTLTAQGKQAGVDWRTGAMPSVRRFELGRAVIRLAGLLEGE